MEAQKEHMEPQEEYNIRKEASGRYNPKRVGGDNHGIIGRRFLGG